MPILDFELGFLKETVRFIDSRLEQLDVESSTNDYADEMGIYESVEHLIGIGFVGCQHYITATSARQKLKKHLALDCPPHHRCGTPMAAIINAGANYWKHSTEWGMTSDGKAVRQIFEDVGASPTTDYPISQLLHRLTKPLPMRFQSLVPFLVSWRDSVREVNGGTA